VKHAPLTIVITDDLSQYLIGSCGIELEPSQIAELDSLIVQFIRQFHDALPPHCDFEIRATQQIAEAIHESQSGGGDAERMVALDQVVFSHFAAVTPLGITSVEGADDLLWCAKPGFPSPDEQAFRLSRDHRPIRLLDVGIQHGSVLRYAVDLLRRHGNVVSGITVGIGSERASRILRAAECNVRILEAYPYCKWIELRDLLAFDGRRVMTNGVVRRLPTLSTFLQNGPLSLEARAALTALCRSYRRHILGVITSASVASLECFGDILMEGPAGS
jgi:hypothetical protein